MVEDLYKKYGYIIFERCYNIVRCEHDAHDATQIVFMRLLEKYDSLKDREQVIPWIFVTARNCCFNMLRDNKKFIGAECSDEIGISDRIDEKINARQLISLLFKNFDRNVRDAVLYTYVEQLEQKDIQKITGQSPATIRRNLKKFKDYLPSIKKRLGLV